MAKPKKGRPGAPPGKAPKPKGPGKGSASKAAGKATGKPPAPKGPGQKPPVTKGTVTRAGKGAAAGADGVASVAAGDVAAAGAAGVGPRGAPADQPGRSGKPTRTERLEAERRARRRRSRLIRVAVAVAVALVLGVVATLATAGRRAEQAAVAKMTTGSCRFDREADADDGPGRNHFSGGNPTYKVNPPAGGNHVEQAAPPAVYPPSDVPPDGRVVHAMEHGYVVLWRQLELSEEDEKKLEAVADRFEGKVLVVPRPQLTVPVAATAWHRRLLCDRVEEEALSRFIRAFLDKGPEKGFVDRT